MKYITLLLIGIMTGLLVSCGQMERAELDPEAADVQSVSAMEQQSNNKPPVQIVAAAHPPEGTYPIEHEPAGRIAVKPIPKVGPFNVRRCINMGHGLEADWEGAWGYQIRSKHFFTIAEAGFDTVRIPIRWDLQMQEKPPYEINPEYLKRVAQVVNQAQTAGLQVIINVHNYYGLMEGDFNKEAPRFLAIWDQVARKFADYPQTVYFELLNEPTHEIKARTLINLYHNTIRIIRKTNPYRKLIIGGNEWNSIGSMQQVTQVQDTNIVATFHDYGPMDFTHQGAHWVPDAIAMGRIWGSKADKAELAGIYKTAWEFKQKTNLPVFVGEFGVYEVVPLDQRVQWMKYRRQEMEAAGLSWCVWDFGGGFELYDVANEHWYPGVLDALFSAR